MLRLPSHPLVLVRWLPDAARGRQHGDGASVAIGGPISKLKARAMLVDTEDGVVRQLLNGPLGEIFDSKHIICDQVF